MCLMEKIRVGDEQTVPVIEILASWHFLFCMESTSLLPTLTSLDEHSHLYSGLQISVILMNIQKVKLLGISFLGTVPVFSLSYFIVSLLVCVSQGDPLHVCYRFP